MDSLHTFYSSLSARTQDTIHDEFEYATSPQDEKEPFDDCCSFEGRCFCLLNIPVHCVGVGLRPVAYLIQALFHLVLKAPYYLFTCQCEEASESVGKAFHAFACVFISPFGQMIKMIRSTFGIFHPGIYYR